MTIRNAVILALLLITPACAVGPGDGWSELAGEVRLTMDPRTSSGDGFPTTTNYRLDFESIQLTVDKVEFIVAGQSGSGEEIEFDPANPPPGYSLCHNGHCHADDGSLPSYDEVRARLRAEAGGTQERTLVTLAMPEAVGFVPGTSERISIEEPRCEPSCAIDEIIDVQTVALHISRIQAAGTVSDRRTTKRIDDDTAWAFDLEVDTVFRGHTDIVIGPDGEALTWVEATFSLNPRIFDADWAAWATAPTDTLPEGEEERIIEALLESQWNIHIDH